MDAIDSLLGEISRRVAAEEQGGSPGRQQDSREVAEDLATLTAHRDPRPGVRMAGRAPDCATCGETMPCASLRGLAAKYDVSIRVPDEELGVQAMTGVVGPTGVQSMTSENESSHEGETLT